MANDANGDQNGNGISNLDEFNNSPSGDPDRDQFTNEQEGHMGTNPRVYDVAVKSAIYEGIPLTPVQQSSPLAYQTYELTLPPEAVEWEAQGLDVQKFIEFQYTEPSGTLPGWVVSTFATLNEHEEEIVRAANVSSLTMKATSQWDSTEGAANRLAVIDDVGCYHYVSPFKVMATTEAKVEMAVDANRDGEIHFASQDDSDKTAADKPFRFWVNDDADYLDADQNPATSQLNNVDGFINGVRDLEDFAQLTIKANSAVKTLIDKGYKLAIVTTGGVEVNVFKAAENGLGYLTDINKATVQATSPYQAAVNLNDLNASIKTEEYGSNPIPFIFEGKTAGTGAVKLVLKDPQGKIVVSSDPIYVKLQNIKEMYERASLDDGTDEPLPLANEINLIPADPNEEHQLIVFIHGWNMTQWEYENFSETMFKRLWWCKYKGRFAALRWPTKTEVFSYNTSELIAFKSGLGASRYLNKLRSRFSGYSINVAAHSMGNIVMMQALKEQLAGGFHAIDNYVLMQGAVPAHCYDMNAPQLVDFLDAELNKRTPHTYFVYPGAINSALRINGKMVNFYNANDYALATGTTWPFGQTNWQQNQLSYKPDTGFGYDTDGINSWQDDPTFDPPLHRDLDDPREIMAFVARPRTRAVGAQGATAGVVAGGVDLRAANIGFDRDAADHSGQFNRTIQQLEQFYSVLLDRFGIQP